MTIELMDGRTGEAHISSEDWATFNAATYGVTEGVFDWGDGFKLSMSTSNKGTLGAGAGLVDGKRVWVKTPESVTIESGGQGVKRHDVVGIQYETHSTNLERAVVKVVKGTPSASPADPDLPSKFLPLWRVPLDGLNVGAPVALFEKLPTAAGLRDSVSHDVCDGCKAVKRAGIVAVTVSKTVALDDYWSKVTLGVLPDGMRPSVEVNVPVVLSEAVANARLVIETNGYVSVQNMSGVNPPGNRRAYATATYAAA